MKRCQSAHCQSAALSERDLTTDAARSLLDSLRIPTLSLDERCEVQSLLTAREVAALLKVGPKRVYELNIPFVQLSARCKRWQLREVQSWIETHSRPSNT
jgi:predicted DNA-binding transcriptional regulator AlpA